MPRKGSILNQLTTGLMDIFVKINQEYYFQHRIQSNAKRKQAQTGVLTNAYYEYHTNERLNSRYVIKSSIGKGSFGEVVLAWDETLKKQVAIKIIRSGDLFIQQSRIEIQLYQKLQSAVDSDRQYIVQLLDSFMHNGHRCLVFEQLHYNLFDILRFNNFNGINIRHVQRIAYQLFHALQYIHNDTNRIIHCDVKPENILLTQHNGCDIKLIDFGSSSQSGSCVFSYIQSRYYRAPEVILGLPYSSSIDMWSVACVLFEMCSGYPLFRGRNELEQIILISNLLGPPPMSMLMNGRKVDDFYLITRVRNDGNSRFILRRSTQITPNSMFNNPEQLLEQVSQKSEDYILYYELVQLLKKLLVWEGSNRLSASEALATPFFTVGNPTPPLDQPCTGTTTDWLVNSQPATHPDRSCESLSACLQQESFPAKLRLQSPRASSHSFLYSSPMYSSPSVISPHPVGDRRQEGRKCPSFSIRAIPTSPRPPGLSIGFPQEGIKEAGHSGHLPKQRRVTPSILTSSERELHSAIQMESVVSARTVVTASSPFGTTLPKPSSTLSSPPSHLPYTTPPVGEKELAQPGRQLLTPHLLKGSVASPFGVIANRTFTADDYRTPTPSSLALQRQTMLPQPPCGKPLEECNSSRTPMYWKMSHPPSFEDILLDKTEVIPQKAISPMKVPLPTMISGNKMTCSPSLGKVSDIDQSSSSPATHFPF